MELQISSELVEGKGTIPRTLLFSISVVRSSLMLQLKFDREQWPQQLPLTFTSGVRDAYLDRISALQQFKFVDPLVADFYTEPKPYHYILLDKNSMILSQVFWLYHHIENSCIPGISFSIFFIEKPSSRELLQY